MILTSFYILAEELLILELRPVPENFFWRASNNFIVCMKKNYVPSVKKGLEPNVYVLL